MAKNAISACRILSPCLRAGILVALAPWASCFLGLLLPGHMQCKNLSRPEPPGPAPQLPPCSRGHGRLRHSGLLRLWTRSNSFLFPGHLTVHLAHKATLLPLLLRTPGIVGAELRPSGSFFRPRATGGVQPWGKGYKSVFQQMIPEPFSHLTHLPRPSHPVWSCHSVLATKRLLQPALCFEPLARPLTGQDH